MRMISSLVLAVLASQVAWGQAVIVDRAVRTRPDFDFLYDRLSASEFVVRGRLLDEELVSKRLSHLPLAEIRRMSKEGSTIGGALFTIEPYETVCRQSHAGCRGVETLPPRFATMPLGLPPAPKCV